MISRLPQEIQNKIFYYVGGNIEEKDVREQIKAIEVARYLKTGPCRRRYAGFGVLEAYPWWDIRCSGDRCGVWPQSLLRALAKGENSDWCKRLFLFIQGSRKGVTISEVVDYLTFCFHYVNYLKHHIIERVVGAVRDTTGIVWAHAQQFILFCQKESTRLKRQYLSDGVSGVRYDRLRRVYTDWIWARYKKRCVGRVGVLLEELDEAGWLRAPEMLYRHL